MNKVLSLAESLNHLDDKGFELVFKFTDKLKYPCKFMVSMIRILTFPNYLDSFFVSGDIK